MTFSIVACEPHARQLGVAVASKFLAVGAVVPWLEAEVGAIATQALANTRYGPDGLAHLRDGASAREALDAAAGRRSRPRRPPGRDRRRARALGDAHRAELHGLGGRPRGRRLRRAGQHPHRARRRRRDGRDLRGEQRRPRRRACCSRSPRAMPPAATAAAGSRRRSSSSRPAAATAATTTAWSTCACDDHAGPGRRAAPAVRHPRPAHRHDARGAEAAARGRARATRCASCSRAPAIPSEAGADGLHDALRAFVGTENLEARWWHEDRLDPGRARAPAHAAPPAERATRRSGRARPGRRGRRSRRSWAAGW